MSQSFDQQQFLKQFESMHDIAISAIDSFIESLPESLSQLETALGAKDGERLKKEAHALKGAIANFYARRAQQLAADLESSGACGNLASAFDQMQDLKIELGLLEKDLQSFKKTLT